MVNTLIEALGGMIKDGATAAWEGAGNAYDWASKGENWNNAAEGAWNWASDGQNWVDAGNTTVQGVKDTGNWVAQNPRKIGTTVGEFIPDAVAAAYTAGGSLAVTGAKVAGKEVLEEAGERVVREALQEGTEKAGKEALEAGAKRSTAEVLEQLAKHEGGDIAKVITTDVIDWTLIKNYIKHLQDITGRKLNPKQIQELKNALRNKKYEKLSPEETLKKRKEFNKVKDKLINEWEKETGQTWPKYQEDVLNKDGKIIRKKGDKYDAHHVIENNYGGDDKWWNMHPAKFPDEHQGGIHGKGAPSRELFK